jgi:DNA-binding CsgD family transcriptional regulator
VAEVSPVRVFLVGVSPSDLDRLRRLVAANTSMQIVERAEHADAVLMTPEALARLPVGRERRPAEAPPVEALTARERDVLAYVAEGHGNREIGQLLSISEHTVKFHLASIYGKLGVGNRTEAVQHALRAGLLEI